MSLNEDPDECTLVTIDDMLLFVGPWGRYQKLVTLLLFIITLPPVYQVMLLSFATEAPPWRCVGNGSLCVFNGTLDGDDQRRYVL